MPTNGPMTRREMRNAALKALAGRAPLSGNRTVAVLEDPASGRSTYEAGLSPTDRSGTGLASSWPRLRGPYRKSANAGIPSDRHFDFPEGRGLAAGWGGDEALAAAGERRT